MKRRRDATHIFARCAARNRVKTTQVAALEAKWQEPRWKGVERPYSAQDVVAMRGTLQGEAPYQDATAQKLFETLDLCANTGGHSRTYGALDPVQAATMAPKLTSIYVSGWQCSSTSSSSNEPGPDFADYPYDTVLTQCFSKTFPNFNLRRRRRREAISRRWRLHDHMRVYASWSERRQFCDGVRHRSRRRSTNSSRP